MDVGQNSIRHLICISNAAVLGPLVFMLAQSSTNQLSKVLDISFSLAHIIMPSGQYGLIDWKPNRAQENLAEECGGTNKWQTHRKDMDFGSTHIWIG